MSALMKQTRYAIPHPGWRPRSLLQQPSAAISSPTAESSLGGGGGGGDDDELASNSLRASSAGHVDSSLNLLVLPAAARVCLDAAQPPDNSPIWHRRRCLKSNYRRSRISTGQWQLGRHRL